MGLSRCRIRRLLCSVAQRRLFQLRTAAFSDLSRSVLNESLSYQDGDRGMAELSSEEDSQGLATDSN